jgi:Flp pilus assembly protein TadG
MSPPISIAARFRRDDRGVAAVEFALVTPMLLALYVGGFAMLNAAATSRKVTDTTAQVTNIAAQFTSMQASDAQGLMAASSQIMSPYSTSSLSEVLTLVNVDAKGNATVTWSQPYNGGVALAKTTPVTLPPNMAQPNMSVIWVQTSYTYKPTVGASYFPATHFQAQLYAIPRSSLSIPCSDC